MELLYIVLSNFFGGSSYPAISIALRGFPQLDLLFLRMAGCALLFAPVLWSSRRRFRELAPRDWALLAAVGVFGYALPLALGTYGQKLSSASSASLLLGMEPVSIVVLSAVFLRERLSALKAFALAAGLSGAGLIAFQGLPRLGAAVSSRLAGDLMLAAAGVCWALYTVIGKPLLGRVRPLDYTAATSLLCFIAVAAWAGPRLSPGAWRAAGAREWLALLYLTAGGSLLGALFWNLALRTAPASRLANFVFLQPLIGVALGAWLLGEPLSRWTLYGAVLVLAGMWTAARAAA